jgi:hypothetical protein
VTCDSGADAALMGGISVTAGTIKLSSGLGMYEQPPAGCPFPAGAGGRPEQQHGVVLVSCVFFG